MRTDPSLSSAGTSLPPFQTKQEVRHMVEDWVEETREQYRGGADRPPGSNEAKFLTSLTTSLICPHVRPACLTVSAL